MSRHFLRSTSGSPTRPAALIGLATGTALLLTGCSGGDSAPTAAPSPTVAPVATDLTASVVERADFCDRVDALVLREGVPLEVPGSASSADPTAAASPTASRSTDSPSPPGHTLVAWTNGDLLEGRPGADTSHEFGCRWGSTVAEVTDAGYGAAAWVFAPPVTTAQAQTYARALQTKACQPVSGAVTFASTGAALTCTTKGRTTARYAGLFGDAWLVCEVTGPEATTRAGHFCPALVTAIRSTD